jgi:hypothetical protein
MCGTRPLSATNRARFLIPHTGASSSSISSSSSTSLNESKSSEYSSNGIRGLMISEPSTYLSKGIYRLMMSSNDRSGHHLAGNTNAYSGNTNAYSGNTNAYSGNTNVFSGNTNVFSGVTLVLGDRLRLGESLWTTVRFFLISLIDMSDLRARSFQSLCIFDSGSITLYALFVSFFFGGGGVWGRPTVCRYIGQCGFRSPGLGLETDVLGDKDDADYTDGTRRGIRYFSCKEGYGLFIVLADLADSSVQTSSFSLPSPLSLPHHRVRARAIRALLYHSSR